MGAMPLTRGVLPLVAGAPSVSSASSNLALLEGGSHVGMSLLEDGFVPFAAVVISVLLDGFDGPDAGFTAAESIVMVVHTLSRALI